MIIGWIQGATRCLGQSQGYIGLPLRDEVEIDNTTGKEVPVMKSAWIPTPAEIALIVAGAPLIFTLYGDEHPPCRLEVGKAPE